MKHEAGRQAPTVENPRNRTSGNEGQFFFGQKNPISRREFFKKAVIGSLVATPVGRTLLEITHRPSDVKAIELNPEEVVSLVTGFPDVPMTNPYYEAITGMAEAGIIGGYKDGTFGPNDSVKRAQFAKMIVGTMELPVGESQVAPFTDLGEDDPNSLYPHDYIAVAAEQGITKGTSATEFSPWKEITRAQVITMAVRAAENLKPGMLKDVPADYESTVPNFSDTHWQNLRKAEYNGLLIGLEGYSPIWDAWQNSTRGECAQILWNLMNFKDREQPGEDILKVMALTKNQLPEQIKLELDKYPSNPTRIRQISAGHPVNANREIAFYLARTEGPEHKNIQERYVAKEQDNGNYLVTNYFPTFVIVPSMFKVYLAFDYIVSGENRDSVMSLELSKQFGRQNGESEAQYKNRILNLTSQIESEHGENGVVRPEEITGLLKESTEKVYFYDYPELIAYDRVQGQGSAIDKLIDSL